MAGDFLSWIQGDSAKRANDWRQDLEHGFSRYALKQTQLGERLAPVKLPVLFLQAKNVREAQIEAVRASLAMETLSREKANRERRKRSLDEVLYCSRLHLYAVRIEAGADVWEPVEY